MSDTSGINNTISQNIAPNGRGAITAGILASVLASGGLTAWVATQYPPHVASLAALQTFTSPYATTVFRDDYAIGNGAPPMTYKWKATCPGTPDNIARYVQPTGSAPACWSAASDPNVIDTREWGAVNDSTPTTCGTNNSAAFNAAFTALGAGARLYSDGPSCLKSTVTMTQSGQSVACKGGGFSGTHHDVGAAVLTAPAPLVGGTVGMTMFTQKSATIQAIQGLGMDCVLAGNGVAASGLDNFSIRGGNYNVTISHFSTTGIKAEINGSQTDAAGSAYNTYNIYVDQGGTTDGAVYQCFGNATWDCSQDQFQIVTGVWNGRIPALDFDGADTEQIHHLSLYNSNVTAGVCGIRFRAGATWVQTGRNNFVDYVGISSAGGNACPVNAEGTEAGGGRVVASNWNNVNVVDTATGGNNAPHIGTPGGNLPGGAAVTTFNMLWWGTNATPYGLNYFTVNGATSSQRTNSGIITNRGTTTTITHGTYQDVSFSAVWSSTPASGAQLALPTACLSETLNPNYAAKVHAACVPGSPTLVRIFNDDPTVDAAVIYEMSGY